MIITIVTLLIAVTVVLIIRKKNGPDEDTCWVGGIIMMTLIGSILLHLLSWPMFLNRYSVTEVKKITAMKTDSRISGDIRGGLFFVRCHVDETDYYMYLTESNGVFKQEKVPVENTVIVETSGTPHICRNMKFIENSLPRWIRFKEKEPDFISELDTLYVPEGTVSECSKYEVF